MAVLADEDPAVRISHPDLIWDDGLDITETQKAVARAHPLPERLLQRLWDNDVAAAG